LLQVLHERRAAGADVGVVARDRAGLLIDVARGVLEVARAEARGLLEAGIERVAQARQIGTPDEFAERRLRREILDETAMRDGAVVVQLVEEALERIVAMPDAEQRIHCRNDRALRSGLAAEGLGLAAELFDAFVDQAFAE